MTPTQTQIEAERAVGFREGVEWAKKNLTAAAEAGEKTRSFVSSNFNPATNLPHTYTEADLIAATIERCAQVAETFGGHNVPLIAAEIRALKDQP